MANSRQCVHANFSTTIWVLPRGSLFKEGIIVEQDSYIIENLVKLSRGRVKNKI
jgi:hypothetical protein